MLSKEMINLNDLKIFPSASRYENLFHHFLGTVYTCVKTVQFFSLVQLQIFTFIYRLIISIKSKVRE